MKKAKKTSKKVAAKQAVVEPAEKRRIARIYRVLEKTYPDATCALTHHNAYELIVATILSAQCTDARVNMVTPALFERYPTPGSLAQAKQIELETMIRSTGFYRNKAKNLIGCAQKIMADYDGQVPQTMEALLTLPGVARKTANVVLGNAFNKNVGVVVDTHIGRLSQRLGLTKHKDPVKIEQDLMVRFARKSWTMLAHLLIAHGRAICSARKPQCEECPLAKDCPKMGL